MHELLGAYVVDALDEHERAAFEAHLADCAACAAELPGLRDTLADLASLAEVAPPPQLRARVLGSIGGDRPLTEESATEQPATQRPAEERSASEPAATESPITEGAQSDRPGVERATPRDSGEVRELRPAATPSRRALLALAAAAAAVAGVGGGVVWRMARRNGAALTADEVLAASDARTASAQLTGGGSATVTRSASLNRAVLQLKAPDAPAAGRAYQAWFARPDGTFASAGLLPAGADVTFLLEGDPAGAKGVGVTDEPAGGSPQPTSDPFALVDLPA